MSRLDRPGYSLVELVVVCAILVTLAGLAMPLAKAGVKRGNETELRSDLREMRNAIDEYKRYSDAGLIAPDLATDGYPPDLETLTEGVDLVGQVELRVRFLRRLPVDPMTGSSEWGLRSFQDDWDADSWGGDNVFDVYSLSGGIGLNGVPYAQW